MADLLIPNLLHYFKENSSYSESAISKVYFNLNKLYDTSKSSSISRHLIDLLCECFLKYIDMLYDFVSENSDPERKLLVKSAFSIIIDLSTVRDTQDQFVQYLSQPILEQAVDPSTDIWFGKTLLKSYNEIVKNSDDAFRILFVTKNSIYMCKLADLICSCGDYEYQTVILETLFRLNPNGIGHQAVKLFPEADSLQDALLHINVSHFDRDARFFLNIVNKINKNVFSVQAEYVFLDHMQLEAPEEFQQNPDDKKLWVDFNKKSSTIGIYYHKDSLCEINNEDSVIDGEWDIITLEADNILDIKGKKPISNDETKNGCFELRFSLKSVPGGNGVINKVESLKTLKMYLLSKEVATTIYTTIIPSVFADKSLNESLESSQEPMSQVLNVSHKSIYKPLTVPWTKSKKTCVSSISSGMKSLKEAMLYKEASSTSSEEVILPLSGRSHITSTILKASTTQLSHFPDSTVSDEMLKGQTCLLAKDLKLSVSKPYKFNKNLEPKLTFGNLRSHNKRVYATGKTTNKKIRILQNVVLSNQVQDPDIIPRVVNKCSKSVTKSLEELESVYGPNIQDVVEPYLNPKEQKEQTGSVPENELDANRNTNFMVANNEEDTVSKMTTRNKKKSSVVARNKSAITTRNREIGHVKQRRVSTVSKKDVTGTDKTSEGAESARVFHNSSTIVCSPNHNPEVLEPIVVVVVPEEKEQTACVPNERTEHTLDVESDVEILPSNLAVAINEEHTTGEKTKRNKKVRKTERSPQKRKFVDNLQLKLKRVKVDAKSGTTTSSKRAMSEQETLNEIVVEVDPVPASDKIFVTSKRAESDFDRIQNEMAHEAMVLTVPEQIEQINCDIVHKDAKTTYTKHYYADLSYFNDSGEEDTSEAIKEDEERSRLSTIAEEVVQQCNKVTSDAAEITLLVDKELSINQDEAENELDVDRNCHSTNLMVASNEEDTISNITTRNKKKSSDVKQQRISTPPKKDVRDTDNILITSEGAESARELSASSTIVCGPKHSHEVLEPIKCVPNEYKSWDAIEVVEDKDEDSRNNPKAVQRGLAREQNQEVDIVAKAEKTPRNQRIRKPNVSSKPRNLYNADVWSYAVESTEKGASPPSNITNKEVVTAATVASGLKQTRIAKEKKKKTVSSKARKTLFASERAESDFDQFANESPVSTEFDRMMIEYKRGDALINFALRYQRENPDVSVRGKKRREKLDTSDVPLKKLKQKKAAEHKNPKTPRSKNINTSTPKTPHSNKKYTSTFKKPRSSKKKEQTRYAPTELPEIAHVPDGDDFPNENIPLQPIVDPEREQVSITNWVQTAQPSNDKLSVKVITDWMQSQRQTTEIMLSLLPDNLNSTTSNLRKCLQEFRQILDKYLSN